MTEDRIESWLTTHPEWRPHVDLVVMPPTKDEVLEEFPDAQGSDLLRDERLYSSFGVTKLALYVKLRREKQSHRFADMIASQTPPRCMTDDVFFAGMPRLADQMSPAMLQTVVKRAREHGYNPSPDDVYHSGLARFQGDPEAFVSRSMGRTYIRRLCEKRGWACEGAVTVEGRPPEFDPLDDEHCVPLGDDIVARHSSEMVKQNPAMKRLSRRELRDKVLEKHGPSRL